MTWGRNGGVQYTLHDPPTISPPASAPAHPPDRSRAPPWHPAPYPATPLTPNPHPHAPRFGGPAWGQGKGGLWRRSCIRKIPRPRASC